MTWPLLLLLLDYWPLRRPLRTGLLLEKLPLMLLTGAVAVVAFLAQRAAGVVTSLESASPLQRIARAGSVYVFYLEKTFLPRNLAIYSVEDRASFGPALAAGALLLLITVAAVWDAWRGARWAAVGWFWYLGTLVPTIGLVQVGAEVRADRFVYLPQIGVCIALAWTAADLIRRWRESGRAGRHICASSAASVGATLLLAALAATAWRQVTYWRDGETLWTRTLACTRGNFLAYNNRGSLFWKKGRTEEAIADFQRALEIRPDLPATHFNLAEVLSKRGDAAGAVEHYTRAVEILPGYAEAHNNLALALAGRNQLAAAIGHFRKAVEIRPRDAEFYTNLGWALFLQGKFDEAIANLQQALEIDPEFARAAQNLALVKQARAQRATQVAPRN